MAQPRVYFDRAASTLTAWFGDVTYEYATGMSR